MISSNKTAALQTLGARRRYAIPSAARMCLDLWRSAKHASFCSTGPTTRCAASHCANDGWAARLGDRAGLTSRLVRDGFGARILDLLRCEGDDTTTGRNGPARPDRRVIPGRPCGRPIVRAVLPDAPGFEGLGPDDLSEEYIPPAHTLHSDRANGAFIHFINSPSACSPSAGYPKRLL